MHAFPPPMRHRPGSLPGPTCRSPAEAQRPVCAPLSGDRTHLRCRPPHLCLLLWARHPAHDRHSGAASHLSVSLLHPHTARDQVPGLLRRCAACLVAPGHLCPALAEGGESPMAVLRGRCIAGQQLCRWCTVAMLSVEHSVESCLPLACSCNRCLAVQSQMLAPAAPLAPGCIWSGQYLSRAHGPVCQCAPQWLRRSPHAPQHTPQVLDA